VTDFKLSVYWAAGGPNVVDPIIGYPLPHGYIIASEIFQILSCNHLSPGTLNSSIFFATRGI
jgi:hypothetical protein